MAADRLKLENLDVLMPMHIIFDAEGKVHHAGPTARILTRPTPMEGRCFSEIFQIRRPHGLDRFDQLRTLARKKLQLQLREPPEMSFKGIAVPFGARGGLLLNLSFGIGVSEAVRHYDLTIGDFAVTDLTGDMLYLIEAKSLVMKELRKLNERLQGARLAAQEQALTDTLTGLANRRAIEDTLARYSDDYTAFGLMHLDLDYFKQVNDTLGHAAGDHVLRHVAGVLRAETRAQDTVGRFGGDEFVIALPGITTTKHLEDIAQRIIGALEKPLFFNGQRCRISASVGITTSDFYHSTDTETMLADADHALYLSKRAGRARATVFAGASA